MLERKERTSLHENSSYDKGASMKTIALDVLGLLPESIEGNKYLLIDMDMKKTRTTLLHPQSDGMVECFN